MRQFFKDELLFLSLAIFQWISSIYVPFWIIRNVSSLNFQLFFLILFALFLFKIFRYAHKKYKTIGNQYYLYTLIILVGCVSLGSFSMEEFRMLGFNFSESPENAINEYFWVKTLFNFIGLSCLPSLLSRYFEMKNKSLE
ncbi:hypothetical protein [Rodentibacter caecimuris]|uniref:hypothetical protein n=1 Tax=Rodentibacter caecimuris TaxID=1796644 RepID=UPI002249169E|nr:hypothetical protein [Rodentibacter heylii]MCX2960337.1 hypothetical protein [Rodentibacter heylii]